ncbi:hypothetical protein EVAR_30495_1 [Eumeta japonica]|uniref:Uncharacterized protein n=1 Tax=Eumeta variegata TaxID=151549 RepID=A0A4C1VXW7_EUMVA|nr:hypothetical protein EVAR_30495_1 [Eumeta japonica]
MEMPSARDYGCLFSKHLGIGGHAKFAVRTETSGRGHREALGAQQIFKGLQQWPSVTVEGYFEGSLNAKRARCHLRKARVGRLLTVAGYRLHHVSVEERFYDEPPLPPYVHVQSRAGDFLDIAV